MLQIDQTQLSFSNMGLFATYDEWIHPTVTVDSYELIFVVSGEVHIREEQDEYHLTAGDLLLLDPNREHGGIKKSHGSTSFYWLHFYTNDIRALCPQKQFPLPESNARIFREIMHQQETNRTLAELSLAHFLITVNTQSNVKGNRFAHEVAEYARIHANRPLTVTELGREFGYSADHLSKLLRREFGFDAKTLIVKKRLEYIESLLINTDQSIKDIARQCGFEDENNFVKFFKYHENTTPTEFRNRYFYVHMNNR